MKTPDDILTAEWETLTTLAKKVADRKARPADNPKRQILLRRTGEPSQHRVYATDTYISISAAIPATPTTDHLLCGRDPGRYPDRGPQGAEDTMEDVGVLLDADSIAYASHPRLALNAHNNPVISNGSDSRGVGWRPRGARHFRQEWLHEQVKRRLQQDYPAIASFPAPQAAKAIRAALKTHPSDQALLIADQTDRHKTLTLTLVEEDGPTDIHLTEIDIYTGHIGFDGVGPDTDATHRIRINPRRLLTLLDIARPDFAHVHIPAEDETTLPLYVTSYGGWEMLLARTFTTAEQRAHIHKTEENK